MAVSFRFVNFWVQWNRKIEVVQRGVSLGQRTLNSVVIVVVQVFLAMLSLLQKSVLETTLVCSALMNDYQVLYSKYLHLYNIQCTVNTQHTSRHDAIITIRLYLATCFGRVGFDISDISKPTTHSRLMLYTFWIIDMSTDLKKKPCKWWKHVKRANTWIVGRQCMSKNTTK